MAKSDFTRILWVDLEMTGLDERKDLITEVAAIVTDWDFRELAVFESGVRQSRRALRRRMGGNPFWVDRSAEMEEMISLSADSPALKDVEAELLRIVDDHISDDLVLLAGNSVHADARFICHWMPKLAERLHYRILDVSAWKVVMETNYSQCYEKSEAHRALEDIRESIGELRAYLKLVR